MPPIILKVAVPVPIDQLFDFLTAEPELELEQQQRYKEGSRVAIPFGSRTLVGVIFSISDTTDLSIKKLKSIHQLLDNQPLISQEIMHLAQWASSYYHFPIGEIFQQILPVLYRNPQYKIDLTTYYWTVTTLGKHLPLDTLNNAKKQRQLLQLLQKNPQGLTNNEIKSVLENSFTSITKRLEALAYIKKTTKRNEIENNTTTNRDQQLTLNDEQKIAVDGLIKNSTCFYPCLLDGVKGSGKTEVYLQFISHLLDKNKQILVLVPEINLTPQLASRFAKRFNTSIVILHSSVSKKQRLSNWLKAGTADASIIIGTRSAIFTPMPNLGAIILDEEHDLSFKQQDGFRYNARDLAIYRANSLKIPVLLGSATPSLESLANVNSKKYYYYRLTKRAANAHSNKFTLLDVRNKLIEQGISHELKNLMAQELEKNNQILLFQNRRGYSPTLFCHHCGWVARCVCCDANLTVHFSENHLLCHHCNSHSPIPKNCLSCDSTQVDIMGAGTQRIEETMLKLFPGIEVLRIDRDSTRRKGSFEKIIEKINEGNKQILVGTQMLSKGHHFPNVTLVVILDVDQGLFSTDFRALEKMAQSIVQVAGRAGRAEKPGHVILQTHQPDHPFFAQLLAHGYANFAQDELQQRKSIGLPPYQYMALIRSEAQDKQYNQNFLTQMIQLAHSAPSTQVFIKHIQLLGPIPSPMERRAGFYRAQLLVQSSQRQVLQQFISYWLRLFPKDRKIKWSIDIDPQEMG